MSPIQFLRNTTNNEELDYNFLMSCLKHYTSPRNVVTSMLKANELIRIKKGLYVFGPNYARRPFSKEILANMIYGPSYLSREYALAYYGLIPETVFEVTSITTSRNKLFQTSVGNFSYRYLPLSKYTMLIEKRQVTEHSSVLIAAPEKALVDMLFCRKENTKDTGELIAILTKDYRIDSSNIAKLSINKFERITKIYKNKTIALLPKAIREIKYGK